MAGVNKVILVGNVGKIETRYTQDGKPITNLSLATSETWKDKQGQKQEKTEWHNCALFGGVAGVAETYVKKGSKLYLEGKLQTREWEKDGVKRYSTEVVIDGFNGVMQMLDGRQDKPAESRPQKQKGDYADEFDDDLPF